MRLISGTSRDRQGLRQRLPLREKAQFWGVSRSLKQGLTAPKERVPCGRHERRMAERTGKHFGGNAFGRRVRLKAAEAPPIGPERGTPPKKREPPGRSLQAGAERALLVVRRALLGTPLASRPLAAGALALKKAAGIGCGESRVQWLAKRPLYEERAPDGKSGTNGTRRRSLSKRLGGLPGQTLGRGSPSRENPPETDSWRTTATPAPARSRQLSVWPDAKAAPRAGHGHADSKARGNPGDSPWGRRGHSLAECRWAQ
ncbi:MAG: hypothetical protein M2R45_00512 [Verrucomicrobia subdivision 3 bacterium]|nr:hypothetical protein [Limisphaerales bacterium]MCS1413611.1 hypothetical protein [Limisphaerales bacterium]